MGRQQFMAELKQLLGDIPAEERDEALNYYEEYFNDAGEENEQSLIMQLESPEKVARSIKSGLEYADEEAGEFSETGFSGFYAKEKNEILNTMPDEHDRGFGRFGGDHRSNLLLLVLILIVLSPIILPILGSIFGLIGGAFGAIIGITVGLFVGGFGVVMGGIACIIASIPVFIESAMATVLVSGIGLLLISLGLMMMYAGKKFGAIAIPGFINIIRKIVITVRSLIKSRLYLREV